MGRLTLKIILKKHFVTALLLLSLALLLSSCLRGSPSDKPAIHLNPNMDDQPRYDPQEESKFFADGLAMRPLEEGTVARGELYEDTQYYYGTDEQGNFIKTIPVAVNKDMLVRGQERYNIFCAPCHSLSGDGKGIVPKRGFLPPPSFHQDNVRAFDDGYIYNVITNGVRNMPAYRKQIPVEDRWAIVGYVRALQRTQTATARDIPEDKLNELN